MVSFILRKGHHGHDHHHAEKALEVGQNALPAMQAANAVAAASGMEKKESVQGGDKHEKHQHDSDPHSLIGVTLVLGFVFMLLVDQIGGSLHARGNSGRTWSSPLHGGQIAIKSVSNTDFARNIWKL